MKTIKLLIILSLIMILLAGCKSNTSNTTAVANEIENDTAAAETVTAENARTEDTTDSETDADTTDDSQTEPYYFDDLELISLSGENSSLYDYEGQLIILNFWATWCTYCEQEMPLLNEVAKQDGITILAVDVGEDAKTVQEYVDRYGYDMNFYLDEDNKLASFFGVSAFPTSIFIGPDFEYYYTYPGMLTDEYLNQILTAIENYQNSK